MTDDQVLHPPKIQEVESSDLVQEYGSSDVPAVPMQDVFYPAMESDGGGGGLDLKRYAFAILRYKWLLALSVVIGLAGAYGAWTLIEVTYTAEGNLTSSVVLRAFTCPAETDEHFFVFDLVLVPEMNMG